MQDRSWIAKCPSGRAFQLNPGSPARRRRELRCVVVDGDYGSRLCVDGAGQGSHNGIGSDVQVVHTG